MSEVSRQALEDVQDASAWMVTQLRAENARLTIERDEARVATDFANLACERKDFKLNLHSNALEQCRVALVLVEAAFRDETGCMSARGEIFQNKVTDALTTLNSLKEDE